MFSVGFKRYPKKSQLLVSSYLQKSYPGLQNTNFTIETCTESKITLEFANVSSSMDTNYTILGLDVLMYHTELPQSILNIFKLDQQNTTKLVTVMNSTFETMVVWPGFDISMSDCYMLGGIKSHPRQLITFVGCNISLMRSTIYGYNDLNFVRFMGSTIYMKDVNFINAPGSITMKTCQSTIHMENVHITNFTSIIMKTLYLHIAHSHFRGESRFETRPNCSVTMIDTIVEQQENYGALFLTIINSARVKIKNCIFSNIAGLLL